MDRSNQYEAAFEAYLQWHGLSYVAIDEGKRTLVGTKPIKNLDFIVLGLNEIRLLIDVKGRRFPGGSGDRLRYTWENWSTKEDIDGLQRWVEVFGDRYRGLLVFMYQIQSIVTLPEDTADLWTWRDQRYLLRAVPVEEYLSHMRVRSPRWGTVSVPGATFRQLVKPFRSFVQENPTFLPCDA